jgi:hypothetical protein
LGVREEKPEQANHAGNQSEDRDIVKTKPARTTRNFGIKNRLRKIVARLYDRTLALSFVASGINRVTLPDYCKNKTLSSTRKKQAYNGDSFARCLIQGGTLRAASDRQGNRLQVRLNGSIACNKAPSRRDRHRAEVAERKKR